MNWGRPFQQSWQQANPGAQAAARQVALGADRSASLLSDALAHLLKLASYAAQDIEKSRRALAEKEAAPAPGLDMAPIMRAMHEVQHGKIPAQRADAHIQHAAQEAARMLIAQLDRERESALAEKSGDESSRNDGTAQQQKFAAVRKQIAAQFTAIDAGIARSIAAAAADKPDARVGLAANAGFVLKLSSAFAGLDQVFLDNKPVDSPVAPPGVQSPGSQTRTGAQS